MASVVDICNLALSHLGNKASVVSISPPDGSVEADYCSRFYAIARDEATEMGDWAFARTRAALVQTSNPSTTWQYAYALPSDCMVPRRIVSGVTYRHEDDSPDFDVEGTTLLTNFENATLMYTRPIEDPTKFPTGFVLTVSYQLAAHLAGPILRGEAGANAKLQFAKLASQKLLEAMATDANRMWRNDSVIPSMVYARWGYSPNSLDATNPVIYPGSGYGIS
jgi:hypothetical protein